MITFLLFNNFVWAQTTLIDNALQQVHAAKSNPEKLTAYLQLFEQHESILKDSLWQYVLRAKQLVPKNDKINNGYVTIALVNALMRLDMVDTALIITEKELPNYNADNTNERPLFFKFSKLKSDCYASVSNYKDASAIIYNTIDFAEKYKDTATLSVNYNALGEIAYNSNFMNDAFKWYLKALTVTKEQKRYDIQNAVAYINLAMSYEWIEKPDSARYYVDKAIPVCNEIQNLYYLCNAYMALSSNYRHAKKFKEAEIYMLQAIDIRKKTEGKIVFSNEQLGLGNLYFRSGQYEKAIAVFKDGLAYDDSINSNFSVKKKASNIIIRLYYYQGLARCYKATGQNDLYEQMLEDMLSIKDTLNQINAADAMADMQIKYETQKKENTIIQQKLDLSKKNLLLYGSIGLFLALLIIFGVIFWSYKSRQELKLQQQIEEDKWQTQQEVAKAEEKERNRIAADLHDNLGVYAASIASNLNSIQIDNQNENNIIALNELRNNSQAIVSQLNDTIWVLKKDTILLTAVSDRIKLLISRAQKSFPNIQFNVIEDIENDIEFSAPHAYQLYRIMQEAINNALKHSKGTQINIVIISKENWEITIEDNGVGLAATVNNRTDGGNGKKNMQERAAESGWHIGWFSDIEGTKVCISPTTN